MLSALIGFTPAVMFAQPSWTYQNTGMNHIILVLNSINISVNGTPVSPGDFIGLFFNTPSGLSCGGYGQWTGTTFTVAAWGTEPGMNNGFATSEDFKWKIWKLSEGQEYDAAATYNTISFPDSGRYVTNGMSGLASLIAQSPAVPNSWHYTNTGLYHLIVISDTVDININGQSITTGDYIGVFYDSSGTLACGGYIVWDGTSQLLYAYGKSLVVDNGFAPGETFAWKIWRSNTGVEVPATPQYDTFNYNDSGNYVTAGVSGLYSLSAVTGPDLAVTGWNSPNSGCQTLTGNEHISVIIKNIGNLIADSFSVSLKVNGIQLLFQNVNQPFTIGSTIDFTFIGSVDFSATDTFNCIVEVIFPPDINSVNNTFEKQLINFPIPQVNISGLQNQYCSSSFPVTLTGTPSGGVFSGGGVVGNLFYHSVAGNYSVNYYYTDVLTGCSNTGSQSVLVFQSPVVNLGPDQVHCFGEVDTLEAPPGYQQYQWSCGGTNDQLIATATGDYSVTVTSSDGCKSIDVIHLTFNPVPSLQITGALSACDGDTVTLDAGYGYDLYLWYDSTVAVTQMHDVTHTGYYKVTVFLNGCSVTDSVFVEFFPIPAVEITGEDSACSGEKIILQATEGYDFYFWSNSIEIFSSTTEVWMTGIYSVTVSNDFGCYGSAVFSVTFFPLPFVNFTGIPLLCAGDTFELKPGKADTYLWSDGSTGSKLNVTTTGIYSVSVTVNGCTGSDSILVYFYEKPTSNFEYLQVVNEFYFTNLSSISENYFWDFGDSTFSFDYEPVHIYSSPGIYTVILTLQNICGSDIHSDSLEVKYILNSNIVYLSGIIPNPNDGSFYFYIILSEPLIAAISITNLLSRPVTLPEEIQLMRGENRLLFDLETLPDGIYLLKFSSQSGIIIHKVIKTGTP